MFRLNKPTKTKSGQLVIPLIVIDGLVQCLDKNKRVIYKELSDFSFQKETKKRIDTSKVIMVKGKSVERKEEEPLFHPNESGGLGGIYEEKVVEVKPSNPETTPEPTPEINETPIEIETQPEIVFSKGEAESSVEIEAIHLGESFEFIGSGKIKVKVYNNRSFEENNSGPSYDYSDLYGGL